EIGESVAADITGGLMRTAIESAVDTADPASRFASRLASRPAAAAADLQGMLDDPNFARLRADARFWSDVEDGNVEAALRRSSFAALADDAQLRQKAADLGLAPDQAATDADLFRDSMALVFREIAPRLRGLRSDPAVKELLADPAVVAMLENGDTIGLLAHPKFRELVGRLSAPAQR
ncbi:MAG TPA: hypothetical protein VKH41_08055, partial [Myxococcota bacterium]|nr:hypothetical protein [Myxococcota bacterium]